MGLASPALSAAGGGILRARDGGGRGTRRPNGRPVHLPEARRGTARRTRDRARYCGQGPGVPRQRRRRHRTPAGSGSKEATYAWQVRGPRTRAIAAAGMPAESEHRPGLRGVRPRPGGRRQDTAPAGGTGRTEGRLVRCPAAPNPSLGAPEDKVRLTEGLSATLAGATGRGGVLVFDDVQWADADTVAVIQDLLHRLPRLQVAVAIVARDGNSLASNGAADVIATAARSGYPTEIAVGELPADLIIELVNNSYADLV